MTPGCRDCGAELVWHDSACGYHSCPECNALEARERCRRLAAKFLDEEEAEALLEWAFDSLRTWHDVESELERPKHRADLLARWQMETA